MKSGRLPMTFAFPLLAPLCLLAGNNVVNMSHYDLVHADFVAMKSEGVLGVIHEATFPRFQQDWRYFERQSQAAQAGLLWGAYHFGDGTNPIQQADHFLSVVTSTRWPLRVADDSEKKRNGVLLVLDFEKNGHYPGGTMTVSQAVAFVQRIKERTGKYPGIYGSENRLRQMLYGSGATESERTILSNCWLWIANYHAQPRYTSPWSGWALWQYTGDGKCGLRPRNAFPTSVGNLRRAERNIFNGNNVALQAFWQQHAWYPSG
ncbi:MAG TPA: glycoside hydrolase family 25 protein [Chthoniobacterales bacterium]|nr:glycoside hydrolase family 25 protein [Chthoniobacterales bacterium]